MDELVAVVLARGLGRRMRETQAGAPALAPGQRAAAEAGLKGMVPLVGADGRERPFLDYVLSALADAGFRTAALVVGPDHTAVRRHYEHEARPTRLAMEWAVQDEPRGTADAVRAAEALVAGRPFVVVNGDNLYPVEGLRALGALDGPGLLVFERDELVRSSGISVERVASFGMPTLAGDVLTDIVEKPGVDALTAAGPRALVSMNAWKFDTRIFAACRDVPRSARGEFELPDAVRLAMTRGVTFRAIRARGPVLDLSRREDIPVVASMLATVQVQI